MGSELILTRWRSVALAASMTILLYGFISGFFLFLFGPLLEASQGAGLLHWLLSLLGLVVVIPFLVRHYERVKVFRGALHHLAGLLSAIALLGVVATGIGMSSFLEEGTPRYVRYELGHLMSGFAFVILLAVHLTLVARIGHARGGDAVIRALINRVILVPILISLLLTVASLLL